MVFAETEEYPIDFLYDFYRNIQIHLIEVSCNYNIFLPSKERREDWYFHFYSSHSKT